ncbi:aldo-keto reductase, partial [Tanacetum coccineum]
DKGLKVCGSLSSMNPYSRFVRPTQTHHADMPSLNDNRCCYFSFGLQFCVSQYEEKDRNLLRSLCHVIGGKLNNKLTKKINFLVCKFSDGPKYEAACQWGIQSVTIEWIWECVKQVSGPSGQMTWIRGCPTSLDNWNIHIDNRTDAVCYEHRLIILIFINCTGLDPARQYSYISFDEQLATLGKAVDAGKIRLIGVSNETPYEVMKFLQAAEKNPAYPRILTVMQLHTS